MEKYTLSESLNNGLKYTGIKKEDGKCCCYWQKQTTNTITNVMIVLDNNNITTIKDNAVCLSLDGLHIEQDIRDMLTIFCNELTKKNLNIKDIKMVFTVNNKKEEEIVNKIITDYSLNAKIIKSEEYLKNEQQTQELLEQKNKNIEGNTTVTAANGKKYNVINNGNTLVANINSSSNNDQLRILLDDLTKTNPQLIKDYNNGIINNEEMLKILNEQLVTNNNLKEYNMQTKSDGINNVSNQQNQGTINYVNRNDPNDNGKDIMFNQELGIIKDENTSSVYKTVDENGRIYNASTTTSSYVSEESYPINNTQSNDNTNDINNNNSYSLTEEDKNNQEQTTNYQHNNYKKRILTPQSKAGYITFSTSIIILSILLSLIIIYIIIP